MSDVPGLNNIAFAVIFANRREAIAVLIRP